jgi:hypothetical protein
MWSYSLESTHYNTLCSILADRNKWNMENLTHEAITVLGQLEENEKFCLKIPAVIGGEYRIENIGKIDFFELVSFSGNLAFKIRDLNDGQNIKIEIKN